MIQLNSDYLIFQTADGENIPCAVDVVTLELIGEAASELDPEIIQNASAAVLHYFKNELGQNYVSVGEFSLALERVLRDLGLTVKREDEVPGGKKIAEADLCQLACSAGRNFELSFFPKLRDEMRHKLDQSPQVLRFKGLRDCVKYMLGAQRWSQRCQKLNDQIVDYLRICLTSEPRGASCSMVVL